MSLIIGFNILVYAFGFFMAYGKGLWKNLIFTFSWLLYSIYYFLTPWYFYSIGRSSIWGDDVGYQGVGENISDYYDEGLLYYGIANLLFLLGFFFITKEKKFDKPIVIHKDNKNLALVLFIICTGLVIVNFLLSGIDLLDIVRGSSDENLFGASGATNYLKNFADSMITCIIICYVAKVDKRTLLVLVLVSFFLFALMGFRYRIIMTILALLLLAIYNYKFSIRQIIRPAIIGIAVLYFFVFITVNRYPLIIGAFDEFEYNPAQFEVVELMTEQTRGMLDDINIIKYYETRETPRYDYGVTFGYFLIRALPRAIVGDWKDQFYPPPAFPIVDEAYNLPPVWAVTGEAPLHYAYFMIAGNIGFLFIGAFVVGLVLGLVSRGRDIRITRDRVFLVILTMALFMWFTRGFFPQFVDNLIFLLIPYFIYYSLVSKKYAEQ
ncbi:MAG: hypothetical protein HOP11_01355 [Saprospiraceae bacterium]|nr:hypothetical protein [Saprospiraceae bacterium]